MTVLVPGFGTGETKPWERSRLIPVFSAALLVSAFLLFSVQPLFTKMILPKLGGTPAVWSVALVFFQAVLLGGYAYAHFVATRLPFKAGVALHLAVTLAAFAWLPLSVAGGWETAPTETGQALWLIGLYGASIGVPFFAVAANGPLLQAWFARTGHPHAHDPYFLYGASNVGSLVALLSYPVLFEPLFLLSEQRMLWTQGFALLFVLIGVSALASWRHRTAAAPIAAQHDDAAQQTPVTAGRRLQWVALAFVPSALLVAVTAHISTDIAAAPFLWIIPLSLFLLTFILTFSRREVISLRAMEMIYPFLIFVVAGHKFLGGVAQLGVGLAVNLAIVFVGSMVCHGNLVRRRPGAANLTEFYLWMSLGGVLGGIFTGLLAPVIFDTLAEYPLLLLLVLGATKAVAAIPHDAWWKSARALGRLLIPFAIVTASLVVFGIDDPDTLAVLCVVAVAGAAIVLVRYTDALIPVAAAAVVVVTMGIHAIQDNEKSRSFFGVFEVAETADGDYRRLKHGTTIHGIQRIRNADGTLVSGRPEPLSYYHARSPMAQTIAATRKKLDRPISVGVIGLGTGTLACYAEPDDHWTFYEIDPEMIALARNADHFSFISECAPDVPIVVGDARLTIARAPRKAYDLLIVDAFSSDAVPVHLLTREAIDTYRSKVSDDGMLVFHISNRFLDLKSVLASYAASEDMAMLYHRAAMTRSDRDAYRFASSVAVLAPDTDNFGTIVDDETWQREKAVRTVTPWSDDYSNVFSALVRRLAQLIGQQGPSGTAPQQEDALFTEQVGERPGGVERRRTALVGD